MSGNIFCNLFRKIRKIIDFCDDYFVNLTTNLAVALKNIFGIGKKIIKEKNTIFYFLAIIWQVPILIEWPECGEYHCVFLYWCRYVYKSQKHEKYCNSFERSVRRQRRKIFRQGISQYHTFSFLYFIIILNYQ